MIISIDQLVGFVLCYNPNRIQLGLAATAEKAGLKQYRLKQIESGKGQLCVWELIRLSDALDCSPGGIIAQAQTLAGKIKTHSERADWSEAVEVRLEPLCRIPQDQKPRRTQLERWVARIAIGGDTA